LNFFKKFSILFARREKSTNFCEKISKRSVQIAKNLLYLSKQRPRGGVCMNQWLADVFFALPSSVTAPYVFGSICLVFFWLCYFFDIRPPIVGAIERHCRQDWREEHLSRPWNRLFFSAARKKAKLDEGGLYLMHLLALLALSTATLLHIALLPFCLQDMALAIGADKIALSFAVGLVAIFSLVTQPRATMERRTRWGFRRPGSIVRAILRELSIVIIVFLWLYDAYFLPALLA
jgi:hypothetical protein